MIIGPVQSIDVTCSKSAENVALRASRHDFLTLKRCSKRQAISGPTESDFMAGKSIVVDGGSVFH